MQFFKDLHGEANIRRRLQLGTALLVEEEGGHPIATGTLVAGEIFGVFVRPKFERRGHGAALMHGLERLAQDAGCAEVQLSVSLPSRRLYEGLGYRIQEERSTDVGERERLNFWQAEKRTPSPPF